ncbi:MAG: prepilin-type N-terminal cleavage/methylation domain-containing protein [Thermodesulfobacteriota bacterium]
MVENLMQPFREQKGFTLVEVVISLMMASIIGVAVYNSAKVQQDTYVSQDMVVGMQDNLRASLLLMEKEIRRAGYNPNESLATGITAAAANQLTFTYDDGTGTLETITFLLYNGGNPVRQRLGRRNPLQTMPVADYIENLEFFYTMADGSQTTAPATLADIRAVQVTVLARTENTDPKGGGAGAFTTPSGAVWNIPAGYRGRMATTTVVCRNMGL